ncbi:hypothetical protein ACJO5Y_16675 [Marinobacter sp. GN3S48]|uniref:hypothetical protein n=1 Tax=Marinobacter sp. GN3S48 TaxID=3382302 RepID=UPI00387B9927
MPKTQKTMPQEFFDYADRLNALDDEGFAEEVIDAETVIEAFLDSIRRHSTELPSRNELAMACMCLAFSTRQEDIVKGAWDIVWKLSNDEIGVSFYSIAPTIEEMHKAAVYSWEQSAKQQVKPCDNDDVPF